MIKRLKETVLLETEIWPKLNSRKILKEGLIVSHSIEIVLRLLGKLGYKGELMEDPYERGVMLDGNGFSINNTLRFDRVNIFNSERFENFLTTINTLGWFVSVILDPEDREVRGSKEIQKNILKLGDEYEKRKTHLMSFIIEAKYDIEVSLKNDVDKLYHSTTIAAYEKIKKSGLSPKSKEKIAMHPGRVYVAIDKDTAEEIGQQMQDIDPKNSPRCVLTINTSKIPSYARFFIDPNAPNAVWTYANIPPQAIEYEEKTITRR